MQDALQQELRLLGELKHELEEIDEMLVRQCDSAQRAYRLCMEKGRVSMSQDDWADTIGMNRSQFKQAISTNPHINKHMPAEAEERLQLFAGNLVMRQWRDLYRAGKLNCQRRPEDRIAQLKAELAREEAARGA